MTDPAAKLPAVKLTPDDIKAGTNSDSFGPDIPAYIAPPPGIALGPLANTCGSPYTRPRQGRPAPLPRLDIDPSTVTFIQRFPNGLEEDNLASGVFQAHISTMGDRLLKIALHAINIREYLCTDTWFSFLFSFRTADIKIAMRHFYLKSTAYGHLLHYGLCASGIVPYWTEIEHTHYPTPRKHDSLSHFRHDPASQSSNTSQTPPA
ncbi:hypothetical protein K439DRAFT_1610390 [Ramaria rubella]|nr:hypothetical protein K439DRAFT_1610390 [Ramaria rubella]